MPDMPKFESVPGKDSLDMLIALNEALENKSPIVAVMCIGTEDGNVRTYMKFDLSGVNQIISLGYSFALGSEAMVDTVVDSLIGKTLPARSPFSEMTDYLLTKRKKGGRNETR